MTAPVTSHLARLALGATLLAMAACAEAPSTEPVAAAPTPPPAPAAAPARPTPAPGQALPIFFELWSAALDAPAEGALRDAAKLALEHPRVPILVTGYADPQGSREANMILSRLRARIVADFLIDNHVPAGRIRILYRGATPGMESLESRRVMVQVDRGQP